MQRDRLIPPFSAGILGCRKLPLHFHKVDPAALLGFLSSLLCTEVRGFLLLFVYCFFICDMQKLTCFSLSPCADNDTYFPDLILRLR